MKRLLMLGIAVIAMVFGTFQPQSVFASETTPEASVSAFYAWFIKNDSDKSYPLNKPDIEKYVAPETVSRLKSEYAHGGPPNGVDYFLKVQDYDPSDWLAHIATHHAIALNGVTVVPVTFGSKEKVDVLVFLKKVSGNWEITKVDDTWEYK